MRYAIKVDEIYMTCGYIFQRSMAGKALCALILTTISQNKQNKSNKIRVTDKLKKKDK